MKKIVDKKEIVGVGESLKIEEQFYKDKEIRLGSLVEKNNYLYYVYEELEYQWKAAQIDSLLDKKIIVEGVSYSSSLKQKIDVPKHSHNFVKLAQANEEEIETNYTCFYKKKKADILERNTENFRFSLLTGSWVRYCYSSKEYIVLVKSNDRIVCLDLSKYLNGILYLEAFPFEKLKLLGYIKNVHCKEILENLQDSYSSYYTKDELKNILTNLNFY